MNHNDSTPAASPNTADTPAKDTEASAAAMDARVADLSYEDARARLVQIVTELEQGSLSLEESLNRWELGEALARRCQEWLDAARKRVSAAQTLTDRARADGAATEVEDI